MKRVEVEKQTPPQEVPPRPSKPCGEPYSDPYSILDMERSQDLQ
jgi:hypothetical protein